MIDPALRHRDVRRVLLLTLAANLAVVVAKAVTGLSANSLSVVAEAAHSSVDAFNNLMALLLARVAAEAPDERHPYGHAKFETLGALAIVAFLSITVFEIVTGAVRRLAVPESYTEVTPLVIGVMIVSAVISGVVARYESGKAEELNSELLAADAAHSRSDVYASLAVVAGLGMVAIGYPWADPLVSLVVAAVIARAGWRIVRVTVPVLVDERAVEEGVIQQIGEKTAGVIECYNVRSRGRPPSVFFALTHSVDATINVEHAHDIADDVENRVAEAVGANEVVVHVEPEGRRLEQAHE